MESRVFIITGDKASGKTTLAESIIHCLKLQKRTVKGFYSKGYWKGNQRSHFELWDIETGTIHLLCTREPKKGWTNWGHFFFNPEALLAAKVIAENAIKNHPQLFVIDEIGKWELHGQGWSNIITELSNHKVFPQLWIIRTPFVPQVIETFKPRNVSIFETGNYSASQVCREIAEIIFA